MFNLGALLANSGDLAGAEHWYTQAAEAGNTDAMNNLGLLREEAGDLAAAEHWYAQATGSRHSERRKGLVGLLQRLLTRIRASFG